MKEVDRFLSSTGNIIILRVDEDRWEVANVTAEGKVVWTETSVSGSHPFTEEEARAEYKRWHL
jgi:hypothetical protein